MGIELNNLVSEFKTGEEKKITAPEPRPPISHHVTPLIQRLATARKRMEEVKKPSGTKVKEATTDESDE
jgi:hypothetical protein